MKFFITLSSFSTQADLTTLYRDKEETPLRSHTILLFPFCSVRRKREKDTLQMPRIAHSYTSILWRQWLMSFYISGLSSWTVYWNICIKKTFCQRQGHSCIFDCGKNKTWLSLHVRSHYLVGNVWQRTPVHRPWQ